MHDSIQTELESDIEQFLNETVGSTGTVLNMYIEAQKEIGWEGFTSRDLDTLGRFINDLRVFVVNKDLWAKQPIRHGQSRIEGYYDNRDVLTTDVVVRIDIPNLVRNAIENLPNEQNREVAGRMFNDLVSYLNMATKPTS